MDFTLVSGQPHSGTSLMMQLLRRAGMELMHDGKRIADDDNLEPRRLLGTGKNQVLGKKAAYHRAS
jgi:hypothetical protein